MALIDTKTRTVGSPRRPQKPLTDAAIRNLRPPPKPDKVTDGLGLYLYLTPEGSKLWRFDYRYRPQGSAKALRRTAAFGRYPEVPLVEARRRRDEVRAMLARGEDPAAARQAEKVSVKATFGAAAEVWLARRGGLAENTRKSDARVLEQCLLPKLRDRALASITAPELLALLEPIHAATPAIATKVYLVLGAVFKEARQRGLCEHDPVSTLAGVLPQRAVSHHPAVQGERAIGALLRAIEGSAGGGTTLGVEGARRGHWPVHAALRLLPLVFVRPSELRYADWSEFELEGAEPTWRIPASRTKMRREHVVPLSRQAVALLREALARTGGKGLVFPGVKRGQPIGENTLNMALRACGYDKTQMVAHGFRAIASTRLNEMGERSDWIERQLAHVERNAVRASYQRSEFLPERRAMMQRWADELDRMRGLV